MALVDSAVSLGAKDRSPNRDFHFIPIGHISLDTEYQAAGDDPIPGTYFIAAFYVSEALQGSGLGRAAMDIVERTAISEPLLAKRLALSTANIDDPQRKARHIAHGKEVPKVCLAGDGYDITDFVRWRLKNGMREEVMWFIKRLIRCGNQKIFRGKYGLFLACL